MGSFYDLLIQTASEVVQSLNKARNLYEQWSDVQPSIAPNAREEFDKVTTELRNALRSIEWDLEDLEEAVTLVVNNPKKFKFDANEIRDRKEFIHTTKEEVDLMKKTLQEVTGKALPVGVTPARETVASLLPPSSGHASSPNHFPSSRTLSSDHFSSINYQNSEPADVDIGRRGAMNGNMFIRKVSNNVTDLVGVNHREDELTMSMMDEFDDSGNVVVVTNSRLDYLCHRSRSFLRSQSNRCILFTILAVIILTTILLTTLILL